MKKLILLIAAVAFSYSITFSQGCLPEGITFNTQAQIDSFPINYPGCTEIDGSMTISDGYSGSITNLSGLSVLTAIGGDLLIWDNDAIPSLAGLENITSIAGDLKIYSNAALASLSVLENVTSLEGSLYIYYNNSLTNLTGLENVTSLGGSLYISVNASLTSLTGLENLTSIGGNLTISFNETLSDCAIQSICDYLASPNGSVNICDNEVNCNNPTEVADVCGISLPCLPYGNYYFYAQSDINNFQINYPGCTELEGYVSIMGSEITNLNGLNTITSIGGEMRIMGTDLTNLSGLENLTSMGGDLWIYNNQFLTSLTGLENLEAGSISDLVIMGNGYLSNCNVQSICNYLANPTGTVDIYGNASDCDSPNAIANSCGIALPCLPYGNYYLFFQTDIDNFQTNYSGCTQIEGNVNIWGGDIANLNGLSVITSIGGNLDMTVGSDLLTSLSGLDNLTNIGGSLTIANTYDLKNLSGLNSLTTIGGDLIIGSHDNYFAHGNFALTSLTGLNSLTSIGGILNIEGNELLTSLSGIDNLAANSITDLFIRGNWSLTTCEAQSICNYLAAPNGTIEIFGNASGCNSPEEVEAACVEVSIESIGLDDEFLLFPNPADKTVMISGNKVRAIREILIYNQTGQKVLQSKPVNNTLDISKLRPGMYILELVTNQGKMREKLIVE